MELITLSVILGAILSGNLFQYLLNSRCTDISCCGLKIKRDVISEELVNNNFNNKPK